MTADRLSDEQIAQIAGFLEDASPQICAVLDQAKRANALEASRDRWREVAAALAGSLRPSFDSLRDELLREAALREYEALAAREADNQ